MNTVGMGIYFLVRFFCQKEKEKKTFLKFIQKGLVICTTYLLCGGMDVLASCLRGRGYSVLPMVVSLVGSCLLRLVWIATIFRLFHTTTMLYLSYPVSWILTTLVHLACLLVVRHKMNESLKAAAQR